jgi:hypothetical protein
MVRLARENGVKVHTFYAQYLGRDVQIWNRDIDHFAPAALIELLSRKTGVPVQRIQLATLRSYEGVVFERLNEIGTTRWILPLGVYHRTRRSYGQQYCPICIAQGPEPYLRMRWRLAFLFVCTAHEVMLEDRCKNCCKPLSPHRADILAGRGSMTRATIRYCAYCLSDLAGEGTLVEQADIKAQKILEDVLRQGYFLLGKQPIYAHLFLDGLRALMHGFNHRRVQDGQFSRVFENGTPAFRRERLREAISLLDQWPAKLISECVATKRTYTNFVRDLMPTPWWLASVLKKEVFKASAKLSKQEVKAILDATERRTGAASAAAARRLSGRDVSSLVEHEGVSENEVGLLMAGIDHRITATGESDRWLLLRDKAMLLAGRRWGMSLEKLASLKITPYQNLIGSHEPLWNNAFNPVDIEIVIAWYVTKVRPFLAPDAKTDSLFVSREGKNIGPSAIHARLERAVKDACLRLGVARWKNWITRA